MVTKYCRVSQPKPEQDDHVGIDSESGDRNVDAVENTQERVLLIYGGYDRDDTVLVVMTGPR